MSTAPAPAPASTASNPDGRLGRLAIICVVAFVAINVAFYFLSNAYFASRAPAPGATTPTSALLDQARIHFAVFSGVIAAAAFVTAISPRFVAHGLAIVLGGVHLKAAWSALRAELWTLGVTLLISGMLMGYLARTSFQLRSRAAWAFLIAMCSVFAVAEVFGAPKIRGALDVSLWITMILPGLNVVAAVGLLQLGQDYVERRSTTATVAA